MALSRFSILSKHKPYPFPFTHHLFSQTITKSTPSISITKSPPFISITKSPPFIIKPTSPIFSLIRQFSTPTPKKPNPNLVNFSLPSDSDSDSDSETPKKPNIPPPYNPFSNNPGLEPSEDPKNLQQVFAKIREDGLMNSAAKMFDGLSQDGLTHEALEMFSQIKDKGEMPDVIAHTAVMEAYANAGEVKEMWKVYLRMLASGVLPNVYTYRVVIKALSETGDVKMVKEARKCFGEMVGRGIKPNAGICVAIFEGLVEVGLGDEGREMLVMLKEKGIVPEESKVREVLKSKRGIVYATFTSDLYGNN